jgi:Flp pilus assembly protein TadG
MDQGGPVAPAAVVAVVVSVVVISSILARLGGGRLVAGTLAPPGLGRATSADRRRRIAGSRPGCHDERGSAPLELVLITVPLLALLMLVALAGRLQQTKGTLGGAARDGARAAAAARSASDAEAAAHDAATADVSDAGLACDRTDVQVDTSAFRAGGTVAVRVSCDVRLSDLTPLPLGGARTVVVRALAPIDVYRGTT